MFNFHNRQYIFRQADGELWNFFYDSRQCLCYNTLTSRGVWSNAVILHKNVYRFFYAEMDWDGVYHIMFQDNNGNIQYSRLDGQSIRTVPVLNSKSPAAYDKHLYIAPLKNSTYLFYVLQHENSFMLAYQALGNTRLGTPKVVDYVSGSNQPCSIIYDHEQNIYVFYQSYDGKYLQLGYKKFNTTQNHWSDFTPVTKYAGNCEYPHAVVDSNGIIHLCYQRRAPKLFEMVYQQKAPDKNLWSRETIVHSSVHSFENASILQSQTKIVVYWVREDMIYYNTGSLDGTGWNKASRYTTQFGHQILCLCYKSNRPGGGDVSSLSPGIYPGILSNGMKLAFLMGDGSPRGDGSQLNTESGAYGGSGGSDYYPEDAMSRLQESVDAIRESWSQNKKEMYKITNAYSDLKKEVDKFSIRLNLVEKVIGQLKKPGNNPKIAVDTAPAAIKSDTVTAALPKPAVSYAATPATRTDSNTLFTPDPQSQPTDSAALSVPDPIPHAASAPQATPDPTPHAASVPAPQSRPTPARSSLPSEKVKATLDPEKLRMWEEWKEPEELRQVPLEPRPKSNELPAEDEDE